MGNQVTSGNRSTTRGAGQPRPRPMRQTARGPWAKLRSWNPFRTLPRRAEAYGAAPVDLAELIAERDRLLRDLQKSEEEHRELAKELVFVRMQLAQFEREQAQFNSEEPLRCGTGRIAEIVPPIAGASLRATVSSPSLAGYLFIADSWHCVLSRLLKPDSTVLDIGCGCGKMARNLLDHPYVARFIGIDAYRPSIDFCNRHLAPRSRNRFEFHFLDVHTEAYNPKGKLRGTDVVFPALDGSVDLAYAASLFTHLLEDDSRHYLSETRRVLAPGGLFLPSIHVEPEAGSHYSGDEVRIDVSIDYFVDMAHAAGFRLLERMGPLCGQEALLFSTA